MTIEKLHNLITLLQSGQYRVHDEKACQVDIEEHLIKNSVPFKKEYNLGSSLGIVDFYLPRSRIAIEVKAIKKWNKIAVFRQCERYCLSNEVDGLLLATGAALTLPSDINGKPACVYQISETSL